MEDFENIQVSSILILMAAYSLGSLLEGWLVGLVQFWCLNRNRGLLLTNCDSREVIYSPLSFLIYKMSTKLKQTQAVASRN